MNILLPLTVTFNFAFVGINNGNSRPCLPNPNSNAYITFVQRHIIQRSFNRQSVTDWEMYIRQFQLCNRPFQSFMENWDQGRIVQICNGGGYPLLPGYPGNPGNLCMNPSTMLVYDLKVNNNCRVTSLKRNMRYVIVACDVVGNQCLPVHFERYINQRPDLRARPCMP